MGNDYQPIHFDFCWLLTVFWSYWLYSLSQESGEKKKLHSPQWNLLYTNSVILINFNVGSSLSPTTQKKTELIGVEILLYCYWYPSFCVLLFYCMCKFSFTYIVLDIHFVYFVKILQCLHHRFPTSQLQSRTMLNYIKCTLYLFLINAFSKCHISLCQAQYPPSPPQVTHRHSRALFLHISPDINCLSCF